MIGGRNRVPIRITAKDANWNPGEARQLRPRSPPASIRRFKYAVAVSARISIASRHVERETAPPRTSVCSGRPPAKHINAMTRTPAHPPPINATNTHQKETIGSPLTNSSSQYRLAYSAACHVESGLYLVMPFAICTVSGPRSFSYTTSSWLTR